MNKQLSLLVLGTVALGTASVSAGTVAHWRFEAGPEGAQVDDGASSGNTYEPGTGVLDSSGNGNDLSVWDEGAAGFAYRTDVIGTTVPQSGDPNAFSVQNTGGFPAMWSAAAGMQSWSPSAWTIEVAFQPELTDSHRTLVGRDSFGTATQNAALAALYFQVQPDESLAIKFCDVDGYWHEAISVPDLVQGFVFPDSASGQWQAAAAVSDGSLLSLYYRNIEASGPGAYTLVAQTDLTASGSTNTALTPGAGSGGDWEAGNWTVGRGMYNGGHGDRAWGFIDEVKISDTALGASELQFVPEPSVALLGGLSLLGLALRRRR